MYKIVHYLTLLLFLVTFITIKFSTSTVIPRHRRNVKVDDDSSNPGLYFGFNKSVILNSTNFNKEIFVEQNNKLWLVEFYNHWCGYCMRFVAVYKAFASEVYEWRDVVLLGTTDCANPMNNEICQNHEIKKVPTMKIFPPNSKENFLGIAFGRGSETTISDMIEKLAQILKTYHNSQESISGPVNLKLLRHSDINRLWNENPTIVTYIMLVFEAENSVVGSQVALDISRTRVIRVRLVDPKNKNLYQLAGVAEGKNAAVVLKRNSKNLTNILQISPGSFVDINDLTNVNLNNKGVTNESAVTVSVPYNDSQLMPNVDFVPLTVENFTREGLNKAIRAYLIKQGVKIAPELPKYRIINTNVSIDEIKEAIRRDEELEKVLHTNHLSTVVFQMDLEAAIDYALAQEVTLRTQVTGEQLDVLRNFMSVVAKYFPTGIQGKKLFTELKEKELDNRSAVNMKEFRKTYETLKQKYNPFMRDLEWVGCRGTIPSYRGYPCSFWTMFHTLVALEELNDRDIPGEEPAEVLNAVAGYIKNFFSCSGCAEHFNEMAKTIAGNVTSQRDALMWLWKAHNNVNHRLAGDETEDPRHRKVQFPPKEVCPSCYNSDDSWNEPQVFNFLNNMFTHIEQLNPHNLPSYDPTTTPKPITKYDSY